MDILKDSSIFTYRNLFYLQVIEIYPISYLIVIVHSEQCYLKCLILCRFFSARKHGLVDAAVRSCSSDRTAFVTLPGGIGTFDEVFEILALIQLRRIGSEFPVPFLLMNYDSFYSKLLEFFNNCENWGTLAKGEVDSLWKVCDKNAEAVAYLSSFYNLCQHDSVKNEVGLESTN